MYQILLFLSYILAVWHVGFQFPEQGSDSCPLQYKHGVPTTGPPGKFPRKYTKHFYTGILHLSPPLIFKRLSLLVW